MLMPTIPRISGKSAEPSKISKTRLNIQIYADNGENHKHHRAGRGYGDYDVYRKIQQSNKILSLSKRESKGKQQPDKTVQFYPESIIFQSFQCHPDAAKYKYADDSAAFVEQEVFTPYYLYQIDKRQVCKSATKG